MRVLAERNNLMVGVIGPAVTAGLVLGALQYDKLPFIMQENTYSAYFAEAGGLTPGAAVQVSGMRVGQVSSIELDGPRVLVKFTVDKHIHLGDRTEAAIKTKTVLGAKIVVLKPAGEKALTSAVPVERTTSPYQLPDALGDLTTTISGLDTRQMSDSLATMAETFSNTSPDLRRAVDGVARLSRTLNDRDTQLRTLLSNANKSTAVLSRRADQIVELVTNSNALFIELRAQSAALDTIAGDLSALARELQGLVNENSQQLRPALDKLNDLLTILDKHRGDLQKSLKLLNQYAMSLGEAVASGPYFNAYVANLLPGQFLQPFIDAAFSDLGLDPNVLPPSELSDPQTGQAATPPLPVPYPRTGQGGPPRLTLPDAITGNPGDPRYPYTEPPPAPPAGGPPPGPPAAPETQP